jgi:hypothetical protein
MMIGFPPTPQQDVRGLEMPTVSQGRIVAVAPSIEIAAADYHAAMPNSSGAAVCYDSLTFAGTHLGVTFHLDKTYEDVQESESDPPETHMDKDGSAMWPRTSNSEGPTRIPSQHRPKRRPSNALNAEVAQQMHRLALHATSSIEHKEQLPLFVPAQTIISLMIRAGVLQPPPWHRTVAKWTSR